MTSCEQAVVVAGSQVRVTFEFTLLTFWPPAPPLRENEKVSSEKGIIIRSIRVMMIA
jgi:hypothetical protein